MCGPLCAIGIAGGLGLSKLLGIDDLTLGIWIGALILSFSVQFNRFLVKRKKNFPYSFWVIFVGTWFLSFLPIWSQLTWSGPQSFCGFPRVIFGSFVGMAVLYFSDWVNNKIIKRHRKVYFPYQRTIIPIVCLILVSLLVETYLC